jgi:hypothetical protein
MLACRFLAAATLTATPDLGATQANPWLQAPAYQLPASQAYTVKEPYWFRLPWLAAGLGTVPTALCFHVPTLVAPGLWPFLFLAPFTLAAGQWYNGEPQKATWLTLAAPPGVAGGFLVGALGLPWVSPSVGNGIYGPTWRWRATRA